MSKSRIVPGHRIKWFVYAGGGGYDLVKMPKTANMPRSGWFAWDAECECGWESKTGGAVKGYVEGQVRDHKWEATGDINHIFIRPPTTL